MYWLYLYNEIHNFLSNSHEWTSYLDSSGLRGMEYTPSPCWGLWHCCTFQRDMTSSRILFHWDSSSPRDRPFWRKQHFQRWSEPAHSRILSNIMKIIVGNSSVWNLNRCARCRNNQSPIDTDLLGRQCRLWHHRGLHGYQLDSPGAGRSLWGSTWQQDRWFLSPNWILRDSNILEWKIRDSPSYHHIHACL